MSRRSLARLQNVANASYRAVEHPSDLLAAVHRKTLWSPALRRVDTISEKNSLYELMEEIAMMQTIQHMTVYTVLILGAALWRAQHQ
jgi:hypothetical protein